jgi:hypothetical protein
MSPGAADVIGVIAIVPGPTVVDRRPVGKFVPGPPPVRTVLLSVDLGATK